MRPILKENGRDSSREWPCKHISVFLIKIAVYTSFEQSLNIEVAYINPYTYIATTTITSVTCTTTPSLLHSDFNY